MKAIELKNALERLIADKGESVEIEISVDVGNDDAPALRVFASPIEIMPGVGRSPGVLLCEEIPVRPNIKSKESHDKSKIHSDHKHHSGRQ